MFFLHDCPSISDIDNMKMTAQGLAFPRLTLELSAKEPLKGLVEQVSD